MSEYKAKQVNQMTKETQRKIMDKKERNGKREKRNEKRTWNEYRKK